MDIFSLLIFKCEHLNNSCLYFIGINTPVIMSLSRNQFIANHPFLFIMKNNPTGTFLRIPWGNCLSSVELVYWICWNLAINRSLFQLQMTVWSHLFFQLIEFILVFSKVFFSDYLLSACFVLGIVF